jgi:2,3-dihydroxyphenylpropionate 1,2-dioxygenase
MTTQKNRRAVLGLSHTPLLGLNPLAEDMDAALQTALNQAARHVRTFSPDLVVMFVPDHFNGFFHDLMPAICIGTEAEAIGDYGTPAGAVNVSATDALALSKYLITQGFDPAVSRRMVVDHGVAQPLQLLFGGLQSPPILPIFINAAAPPAIPTVSRVVQLGRAVGTYFSSDPRSILFVGSGGLSHDPPIPTLEHPDPQIRERIIVRHRASQEQRATRQTRVIQAGRDMGAGTSDRRALNPVWDERLMAMLESAEWSGILSITEEEILREGGGSAHESKNWIAAFAAVENEMHTLQRWYRAIPDLIAGFGIMFRADRKDS